jgi:hypothetical protein
MKYKQTLIYDEDGEPVEAHVWPVKDDGTEFKLHIADSEGMCWCSPRIDYTNALFIPMYLHNPPE